MSASYRDPESLKRINDINTFHLANSAANIPATKIFHTACDVLPTGCSWKMKGQITTSAISYVTKCLQQNKEIKAGQICDCCPESHCLFRIK